MSEKPIERLNYFNGQRLEAGDLRLEQEYHIQVQRWLMKTLFSPGVAGGGFDVRVLEGGKKIRLEPGLALDDLGRAIILVAPVELTPQARLLCIRYAERKQRPQQEAGCAANVGGGATLPARWGGGPERILSQPDIFWRADPPMHDTRELIIAEFLLDAHCAVEKVLAGARHRASPLPVQQVHQVSFEGEKDIDEDNPKVIHFFIRGGRPNAVTLYLRAREFSSLHYSEMGEVTPVITGNGPGNVIQTERPSGVDAHSHDRGTLSAVQSTAHSHNVMSRVFDPGVNAGAANPPDKGIWIVTGGTMLLPPVTIGGIGTAANLETKGMGFSIDGGSHAHSIAGDTGTTPQFQDADRKHKHEINVHVSTTGQGGQTTVRNGLQLLFISKLQIEVGQVGGTRVNCTDKILTYVKDRYASAWSGSGTSIDGTSGDPLYTVGTGPIRLDLIDGLSFEPCEFVPYEIKLSVVGSGNGGCIQYNLYVE